MPNRRLPPLAKQRLDFMWKLDQGSFLPAPNRTQWEQNIRDRHARRARNQL